MNDDTDDKPVDPALLRKRLDSYASAPKPDQEAVRAALEELDELDHGEVARWLAAIDVQERRKRDPGNPLMGTVDYRSDELKARSNLAWEVVALVLVEQDAYKAIGKKVTPKVTGGFIDTILAGNANDTPELRTAIENIIFVKGPAYARRGVAQRGLTPPIVQPPITTE